MKKNSSEIIQDIVVEIQALYEQHKTDEPDTYNQYIAEIRTEAKLYTDISAMSGLAYTLLNDVVKRYHIVDKSDDIDFIAYDVKRVVALLLKPYFTVSYWLRDYCRDCEKKASDYKFEHGYIDAEPTEDIYNATVVYLKEFAINLAI